MKLRILLVLMLVLSLNSFVSAQTVLEVPALDDNGAPIINALITYVVADTNASGEQLHDVYKLQRGMYYYYNQSPVFTNPITLVADEPGDTEATKPPKIMITTTEEGEVPYEHCLTTFADLTVKNIAFSTTSTDNGYSWANAILLQSDGLQVNLEGCHFTLTGWGIIEANVNNTKFNVNKCHIRNATVIPSGDEWCPFFFEINEGSADELIVRNNTFFNLQGTIVNINPQNRINKFVFDHNTCINIVKGFAPFHAHTNSVITNNIFYNSNAHSQLLDEVDQQEDQMLNTVIAIDTLLSNEPGASDSLFIMEESARTLILKNNYYYWSQGVQDYWAAFDSVATMGWMNSLTQSMFDDDANYPNFVAENNVNLDPGFANFGGTDEMVTMLNQHRNDGAFGFWGWDPDEATYPDYHWAMMQWPLPEDFSYSANLTSTDGFHVGSLEYYPEELDSYYEYVSPVEDNENSSTPTKFSLAQNYPNPFNPTTTINYSINIAKDVKLAVYNMLGQNIKTLVNSEISAGNHNATWDGTNNFGQKVTSGIYFYKLETGSNSQVRKMMLLK